MNSISIECSRCKNITSLASNVPIKFICSKCGFDHGIFKYKDKNRNGFYLIKCVNCDKEIPIPINKDVPLYHVCHENSYRKYIFKLVSVTLEEYAKVKEKITEEEIKTRILADGKSKIPENSFLKDKEFQKIKIIIPYFEGNLLVKQATQSWVYPEVVFALTEPDVIPPGFGICKQIYTKKNTEKEGLSKKRKPFLFDLLKKLIDKFPDEDYYGFFNSDIILPPGVNLKTLLPKNNCEIVFHHVQNIDPVGINIKRDRLLNGHRSCGKDGILMTRDCLIKILKYMKVNDLVIGAPNWDDGLCTWCWDFFGRDKVDLRYKEVWHVTHNLNWTSIEADARYNINQIDSVVDNKKRNSINWTKVYNNESSKLNVPKTKILGIVQPGRMGDVLIVLPIAKYYFDQGYKIVWPISSDFIDLFDYINYVEPIDIGPGIGANHYDKSIEVLKNRNVNYVIDLGIGFDRRNEDSWRQNNISFDAWKYKEARVPFSEKYNLQINRKLDKEKELAKLLDIDFSKDYILTHSHKSCKSYNFNIPNSIEIRPYHNYTIFDWIFIIENCKEIYCVDSCVANMVNQLGLCKNKRHIKMWFPYNTKDGLIQNPTFESDWKDFDEEKNTGIMTKVIKGQIREDESIKYVLEKYAKISKNILEIGSSNGESGSSILQNSMDKSSSLYCIEPSKERFKELNNRFKYDKRVKCYNVTSVKEKMSKNQIYDFYLKNKEVKNEYHINTVLKWLRDETEYINNNSDVYQNGINLIKNENRIKNFDLVFMDGSAFTGDFDLEAIYGAKFIIMDDVVDIKNYYAYKKLLCDPEYDLVNKNFKERNGWAVFERTKNKLPIHFFSIVLNGDKYIKKHIEIFKNLPFDWKWHIVEGAAELKYDTAWSLCNGGNIPEKFHKNGLSIDNTTKIIDDLVKKYPDNITVYRPEFGKLWDGKIEMVNSFINDINHKCLLWEVDVDEIWTVENIIKMRNKFLENPDKHAAYFYCNYFVGKNKYVCETDGWANNSTAWLRVWRFSPGMYFKKHEPPVLFLDGIGDIKDLGFFSRKETVADEIIFDHFAYCDKETIEFKGAYYGYDNLGQKNLLENWYKLQDTKGKVQLKKYFPWVSPKVFVDDWKCVI